MNMRTRGRHVALAQQTVSYLGKNRNVLKQIIEMSVMQIYACFTLLESYEVENVAECYYCFTVFCSGIITFAIKCYIAV